MLATRTYGWMILPKDSLISSGCPVVQRKGFVVAMPVCKEAGKTVYARERVWMLLPEHLLPLRQRLSVHRLRLFVCPHLELGLIADGGGVQASRSW